MLGSIKTSYRRVTAYASLREIVALMIRGRAHSGLCPVCNHRTLFLKRAEWLRDFYLCLWCRSIPRQRALMHFLSCFYPAWRDLDIYESSPDGASSSYLKQYCTNYLPSQFWPEVPVGNTKDGVRCENLEALTFEDERFDLIVTQDVFEHVLEPDAAFAEVARVLKPGGAHVFTVPWYKDQETLQRARSSNQGVEYLEEPDYHGNPIDPNGSLVVTEWGRDLLARIRRASGLDTTSYELRNAKLGLDGAFPEVMVSRKAPGWSLPQNRSATN